MVLFLIENTHLNYQPSGTSCSLEATDLTPIKERIGPKKEFKPNNREAKMKTDERERIWIYFRRAPSSSSTSARSMPVAFSASKRWKIRSAASSTSRL